MDPHYCPYFTQYCRRKTNQVSIGSVPLGSQYPVRLQSMTNTPTSDIRDTTEQIITIHKAGADYVRLTVPSIKDSESLKKIIEELRNSGHDVPIIADIHFNPQLAFISAGLVEKVRINPGNFVDKRTIYRNKYTDEQYEAELVSVRLKLQELIGICKKHNTALRIGVNHGSLSGRIMNRYGDTPEGMAESAMEFLRICVENDFYDVVVSMKASNTRIMVYATRLLVKLMERENMQFPLHLGVTEAGEGEDGRIKSAAGIGTLLIDGIGDTVRVSLTEDPVNEIPVARKLVDYCCYRNDHAQITLFGKYPIDPYSFLKRESLEIAGIGGKNVPVVVVSLQGKITSEKIQECGWFYTQNNIWKFSDTAPDIIACDHWPEDVPVSAGKHRVTEYIDNTSSGRLPILTFGQLKRMDTVVAGPRFIPVLASDLTDSIIQQLQNDRLSILVLSTKNKNGYADLRAAVFRLINAGIKNPILFRMTFSENSIEDLQLKAAAELGGLFIDGLGEGIWIENDGNISISDILSTSFGILQASRVRVSKAEYIACPSCGRTLFDIQATTRKIREITSHLKGIRIGIMGCIVNGPGEMADADYGYIGSGIGKITLYKGKEVVKRNLPEDQAVLELVKLIKENGDWTEPHFH